MSVTVSHYRLLERLGEGGMGEVWLAEDTQLPRRVAVKLLPAGLAGDREAVERLLREAQSAASVDHPNVVTVYDAGLHEGRPFLAMQLVEGETLEQRLARGALPIGDAIALAVSIADALAEVHALGIVHRDLKPANIMLTPRGPKIFDFGIASVRDAARDATSVLTLGTPAAMSPEQFGGARPDNRSDLWSVGVILYQALTGVLPFEGATFEAIAANVLNFDPPAPSARRSGVGPDLDFIVLKLLRKNPAQRYARAEDLIADLTSCRECRSPETPAAPAAEAPRLAVLYFEVLSSDADDAFVAAGLTEDLIVDLARVAGLRVASRTEVMPFRDRALPARTLGRELNVDYVLQGSVRRLGARARISAQLVRASDGHAVWAERFDRTLEDLFDVQAEVSRRIVDALAVTLNPGEREMLDRAPTSSAEAYAHYLKAREHLDEASRSSNLLAEEQLKRAIELDPRFALALATLGECHVRRGLAWWAGLESADEAMVFARRALELEPDLLEAHLVVAMSARLRNDVPTMDRAIERVLALEPDHGEALEIQSFSLLGRGMPERAVPLLERVVARHPDRYLAAGWIVQCYEMLGRKEDERRAGELARERLVEFVRRHPANVHARTLLGIQLIRMKEPAAGLDQIERTLAIAPNDGRVHYNAACAFALAGMPERALEELRRGIANLPSYIADWPKHDSDLAALHGHPEFIRLFGKA